MSDIKELSQRQVSLEKVVPLNSNRLVTFVNHFLTSIVQQLNELTAVVDSRLYHLNHQIHRCNANLVILEMKLNSITGLSSVAVPSVSTSAPAVDDNNVINDQMNSISLSETTANNEINGSKTEAEETNSETTNANEENEQNSEDVVEEEEEAEPEDPRMAKYKKMVQLGIPLDAVHQKMMLEGVDPQLLK